MGLFPYLNKKKTMKYVRRLRTVPRCLHCGEKINYGRTDKRYCCDDCRVEHNNLMKRNGRIYRRRVLSQLASNYDILETILRSGADAVMLADIVSMGFSTSAVTSYSQVGKHVEFGCFDIKYRMTSAKVYSIYKIQNVSLNLHADFETEPIL
jgi:hypothetical protein